MKIHFLKFSLFILSVLLFISCGRTAEEKNEIPSGILGREEMVKLLRDFALAESAATMNVKGLEPRKNDSVYAFNPLKENNVRQSHYDSSLSFYISHPEIYNKVYEDVLVALSEFQTKRNGTVKDSVSK